MKPLALQSLKVLLLCTSLFLLTSCEQDEDEAYGRLVRYFWVGDLGFTDNFGEPVESGLSFDDSGFGTDEQCYYNDGYPYATLPFRWMLYDGTLSLDYGNKYPLLEIRGLYVGVDELSGSLYINGQYWDHISLYRY